MKIGDKIITTLYDAWADRQYAGVKSDIKAANKAIENIGSHFKATGRDALYVESTVMEAAATQEELAFFAGFYLCLEMLSGNIFTKEE